MTSVLYFLIIIIVSYGLGKRLLDFLLRDPGSRVEDFVFSTGLGLGIIGYAVYAIGSMGFLYLHYVLAVLIVCGILAISPAIKYFYRFKHLGIKDFVFGLSLFEKMLLAVLIVIPVVCLFGVLSPEIGNDALSYHIYHPKVFIENHKIGYISFSRESLWPYLTEMFFTIGLLFKSVTMAKMFHYFFGILSALSVFAFARRFFGKKEALLSSALFYSAPGIFMQSVYSYIDLSLCFYSFVALYLIVLWNENNDAGILILAGVFAGLSSAVKLLGGITFAALFAIILFISLRRRLSSNSILKNLFIFCGAALLISSVWYLRSYAILKNPVYPFLDRIFTSGWDDKLGEAMGLRRDLIGFLRLPWDLVMNMHKFGEEQIGILSLILLPYLAFLNFKEVRIRIPSAFLLAYALIWFIVDQNIRFIFVGIAVLCILLSAGFYNALRRYNLNIIKALVSLCIIFNLSLCVYYNRNSIKLAIGQMSEETYLNNYERTYPVALFINKNTRPGSVIISIGEPRFFYFDRSMRDYYIWKQVSKETLSAYIERLKKSEDVFLLLRDDVAPYEEIQRLVKNRPAIFILPREVEESKTACYHIYRL